MDCTNISAIITFSALAEIPCPCWLSLLKNLVERAHCTTVLGQVLSCLAQIEMLLCSLQLLLQPRPMSSRRDPPFSWPPATNQSSISNILELYHTVFLNPFLEKMYLLHSNSLVIASGLKIVAATPRCS